MSFSRIIIIIFSIILTLTFQNCSNPVEFRENVEVPLDAAPEVISVAPLVEEKIIYPILKIITEDCVAGNYCQMSIVSDVPVQEEVTGNWATNDSIWSSSPNYYAKPDFHYSPAYGAFKLSVGQKKFTIKVNTLNWNPDNSNIRINIPMMLYQCKYKGVQTPCSLFIK